MLNCILDTNTLTLVYVTQDIVCSNKLLHWLLLLLIVYITTFFKLTEPCQAFVDVYMLQIIQSLHSCREGPVASKLYIYEGMLHSLRLYWSRPTGCDLLTIRQNCLEISCVETIFVKIPVVGSIRYRIELC